MWRLSMQRYRNGSESVCCPLSHTLLLNGLAAIVVFGCLELFLFCFPFCEFSLTFFALIVRHDVWQESASDAFDGMLRNVGVIDEFFTSTQEFLLRMPVVEFEGVLGVFGVCVRHHSFRFCCMKKADPVSSKSLYRCLRVLAVFVCMIIIAKKMCFVKFITQMKQCTKIIP